MYSDIEDKEFYILPILIRENGIYIFSNNYFYENWDMINKNDLIEFILPAENIEIIQNVNQSRNNLLNLKLSSLFKEHMNKNAAIALIEKNEDKNNKVFLKARIQNKIISKSLNIKNNKKNETAVMNKIIFEVKDN